MLLPPAVIVVLSWLRDRGFYPEIKFLVASARTASDAADALNVPLSNIDKSLGFYAKSDQCPVLIIVSGANRVDKEKVGEHLGFKIKTAGPEFVLETTGFPQGGNYGESGQNYVFHAETKLLIEAGPQLLSASKAGKVISLFSTWEPCLMCLGIAVMNKVNRIIYIQKDPHSGSCGIDRSSLGVRYQEN